MTDLIKRKDVYEALEKYFKGGFGSIYDMVEEIPTVEVADRKTEPQYDIDKGTIKCDNCSENGSYKCSKCDGEMYFKRLEVEDEPQTCKTCKWGEWYRKGYDITMMDDECGGCCSWNSKWKPKDEPRTEREIAKAIVHKMIDDAVIAEDAYPDLRQRMHDAVERLDEYYPSEDERSE